MRLRQSARDVSTHAPVLRRDLPTSRTTKRARVSTHAPVLRRDHMPRHPAQLHRVSTHAPVLRRDQSASTFRRFQRRFNSRARIKARLDVSGVVTEINGFNSRARIKARLARSLRDLLNIVVSTHAPVLRRDSAILVNWLRSHCFNSRARIKARRCKCWALHRPKSFQLTRPY